MKTILKIEKNLRKRIGIRIKSALELLRPQRMNSTILDNLPQIDSTQELNINFTIAKSVVRWARNEKLVVSGSYSISPLSLVNSHFSRNYKNKQENVFISRCGKYSICFHTEFPPSRVFLLLSVFFRDACIKQKNLKTFADRLVLSC